MSNMQIKYATLFSLVIEQLFYNNKICKKYQVSPVPDWEIIPVGETNDLMKRMDLVFRPVDVNGGVVMLARVSGNNGGGNSLLRYSPNAYDKISLGMILKNPDVLNQNDIPLQVIPGQAYYFSNEVNDMTAPRNALPLTNDPSGVKAGDLIKTSTTYYRYHSPSSVSEGDAVVKHLLTGWTVSPESLMNQSGEADIFFNLGSLPSGKCRLLIGASVVDTFYYTGSNLAPSLFGIVEIMLASSINNNYRVIESDRSLSMQRPAFFISFKNRETIWRYSFLLQPNSSLYQDLSALDDPHKADYLSRLNILSNDSSVKFKQTQYSNNTILFESDSALFLQENYTVSSGGGKIPLRLKLDKNIGESNQATVKDNLPFPPTDLIDTTTSSLVYSDIFITI